MLGEHKIDVLIAKPVGIVEKDIFEVGKTVTS